MRRSSRSSRGRGQGRQRGGNQLPQKPFPHLIRGPNRSDPVRREASSRRKEGIGIGRTTLDLETQRERERERGARWGRVGEMMRILTSVVFDRKCCVCTELLPTWIGYHLKNKK